MLGIEVKCNCARCRRRIAKIRKRDVVDHVGAVRQECKLYQKNPVLYELHPVLQNAICALNGRTKDVILQWIKDYRGQVKNDGRYITIAIFVNNLANANHLSGNPAYDLATIRKSLIEGYADSSDVAYRDDCIKLLAQIAHVA